MTTAVVLATVPAGPDRLAADLPVAGTTARQRLLSQLSSRVDAVHVVTRPASVTAPPAAGRVVVADPYADLDAVADLLERAAAGPVLLVHGELVLSDALLDTVLADPRPAVTVLSGPPGPSWPIRTAGGVVTAAGSPLHRLSDGQGSGWGLLRVPAADRPQVAGTARAAASALRAAGLEPLEGAAPAQDALAVLLVALVRRGSRVRTVPLRGFVCGRVLGPGSASDVERQLASVDEDLARREAAVKPDDGFVGTFLVSPYSKRLAQAAARRGLRPNLVTVVSMGLGALAAALYAWGDRPALVAGAVVLHAALTLDLVDGQLARYAGAFSSLGAYLDAVFDRVKEYLVLGALAVGAGRHGEDLWTLAALALLLQTTHHTLQFSWPGGEQPDVLPLRGPVTERELSPAPGPRGAGRVATAVSARTQTRAGTRWGKRIVQFPIAERFAVLTLGPALAGPRVTLQVFVGWVCLALAWSFTGRVLRSVSR